MDEYDSYLDSLAGERHLPLRGNPLDDSNQNLYEKQRGGAMTFAATPPDYNGNRYRTRSSVRTVGDRNDTQASRFRIQRLYDDPRERYWKNNHSVSNHEDWDPL